MCIIKSDKMHTRDNIVEKWQKLETIQRPLFTICFSLVKCLGVKCTSTV
jgi:hypothetical protein